MHSVLEAQNRFLLLCAEYSIGLSRICADILAASQPQVTSVKRIWARGSLQGGGAGGGGGLLTRHSASTSYMALDVPYTLEISLIKGFPIPPPPPPTYDSLSDVGEIRVYQRADFQSGSRVLKKVF